MDLNSLIILLPLIGAAIVGLGGFLSPGFRRSEPLIGGIATLAVAVPFLLVLMHFIGYTGPVKFTILPWMETRNLTVNFSYNLDQLSLLMGLIVNGIGAVIHLYSIGYMHGDKGFYKFFLYLNLFIFSMNNLILGDNLVVTFLGWEGVGACSYFLIGFWFTDMEKAKAAQKAFVANRIGDFAFLIAIFLCFTFAGSLDYGVILGGAERLPQQAAFWIALLVFIASTGKSAQIPLYVWLPDAMAGPTPVSALIHAATMVTSGIYLTARLSPIFLMAPEVMVVVCVVGGLTAIVAALIAIAQNDIKKVLAYSTVSQLGFMFMALGAGAFTTAIFHVMTHAFFKACLFLGSGSVIHAMEHAHAAKDPQDIRTMGGLKKYMPLTWITFFVSTLAIAGIPPLAGFFSKDEILGKVFFNGHEQVAYYFVYGIGITTALLTAFYMTRLTFLTFHGKERYEFQTGGSHGHDSHDSHGLATAGAHPSTGSGQADGGHADAHGDHGHGGHHKPHESSWLLTTPLLILGFLAIVGGFLGLPEVIGHGHYNWITHNWLGSQAGGPIVNRVLHADLTTEYILIALSIVIAAVGVLGAWSLYSRLDLAGDNKVKGFFGGFYRVLENKFYVDEFYNWAIIRPFVRLSERGVVRFDRQVIDGIVDGTGTATGWTGEWMRKLQTGLVQNYALLMIVGILGILVWMMV